MNLLPFDAAVLDSSVVIKWFREGEILRDKALALRQAYLDGRLAISIPDLLIYEIANVLRYKPDLTREQVQAAIRSLFDMGLTILSISPTVAHKAIEFAYAYDITIYDALFMAFARELNMNLITADEGLIFRVKGAPYVRFLGNLN